MPIYKNNGVTYNIPDDKAAGFEAKFPGAMVALENEGVKYELPVSKKKGFLEKFPGATYSVAAPPAPKAEDINPTSDKSGYTFTAEELGMPENTYKAESTSVAKLPEIKPLEVQKVKMDPGKLKLQGEALGNLNKEKEMLEAQLDEVRRKASERRKAITSNAGAYQFGMAPVTGNVTSEVADIEMAKLGATENQLEQAIREVDRKISGEDAGFWQGVLDATVRNPGFYTMGMSDMSDARAMLDLSENGINSETDLALADATYENSALQEEADRGFMYRAGNMFGHSIPFMVQMAASGGGTGISKLGGKAAQRFAKETLKHKILRATGVVADDLLESAFIANTAGAGTTQTNILQRKAGQLRKDAQDGYYFEGKNGWLEAAAKGEMSSILEQYTEKFGNHLDGKLSITKGLDKIGAKKISTALAAAKNSDIGKAANTVLTQFGINGVLPEVMEEEANLVLNSIFVGDNKLSDLFDIQTQLDIVGGMFLTVGTMRAIPGTIGSVGYIRNQRKLNAADKEAEAVYGEKWAEMRERLNNASNEEVADVCNSMIGSGDDQALLDYYKSMMVMRGYNIGTTKREDNIPGAEQSYQEGYEAADEQKGAVKQAYDMERERVLNTFGEEVVQKLDDDPIGALMELNEVDRQEAIAYVNARTAYEGMIDRISDDIDERIKASDKEIDSHKNRQDGAIHPAMMRGVNGAAPKRVYIVNGNVATLEDGTIDKANSSSMIIVRDAETGEVSAASADDLESLEAVIDTEAEKRTVAEQIANEYAGQQAVIIEGENVNGEGENGVQPEVEGQKGENAEKVVEPVGEVVAPVVETPKTALEQIPRNENNIPLYEQVDSELAWDGVVEEAGGNEETAMVAVNSMIADKQDALKKAEKAKAKAGATITEKIAAENERVANIERAKADLAKWEEIAGVKAKRALAAEAESKRVADEAAAKQRAEEERLRAEREEAEREALNGVPDMVDDKPQDARARGYRRVNGHKVDRQEPVQGLMGKEIAVKFSDSSIPTGRIAVIEAEQLQPSHIQGQRNPLHFIDEAQPKERNDAASVLSARKIAENVRPEEITSSVTAYTGAPTVNTRGEAVQGNNRSAALRLMWENNPEQAAKYKQYLMDHAAEFGLNAEEIAAMKSPVLVNMLDVSDADAITLGQYVAQDTESGGTERIKPKNVMQKMGGDMRSFANKLLASNNEEASFAELVDANGVEVLKWMAQKGYITPTQYKSAFDSKGNLTAEVKNDLRDVMYQSIFKGGSTQLEEMFNALPAKAQKAILATAFRDYDSPSAERMNGEVQNSIRAYYALARDAAFANAKNYKEAKEAAMMWARQYQLDDVSGESFLPSENFSNFAIELAIVYKGWTQRNLQNHFNNIYDLVQGTKEASLFEEADNTPRTLKEAIKETFNIDYNGQSNSNSLAIDSKDGQARKRGGNGDIATGERIEGGERPADSTGGARGNGEVSSPEIPNSSTGEVVSPVEANAEGGNAPGDGGVAKGRRKPKGFRSSAKKSSEELFAEEKEKAVNGIYSGDYAKVIAGSNSIEEAISQFNDMADAALMQAEEWASREYKKNNTVVTGQNAQSAADEYETTISAANERRREANIKRLNTEAETLRGYANTLAERTGYSPLAVEKDQSGVEKIQNPSFVEEVLENGDKRITNYNSRGEVATVATERDGKVVSVDSYDEGVLFEHTEYDGNGKAASVTRYDKQGNAIGTQVYVDGKAVPSGKVKAESGKPKVESGTHPVADEVLAMAKKKQQARFADHAKGIAEKLGVEVTVHNDESTVTNRDAMKAIAEGGEVKGWYNPTTGEIALFLPAIESMRDVESTILHEAVSHYGIKHFLGKEDFNKFLDGVWEMMPAGTRAHFLQYVGADMANPSQAKMRQAADEYVAHIAEKMDLNELEKSVWQRFIDYVMDVLRKAGFKNLRHRDVEAVIRASYANLRKNGNVKAENGKVSQVTGQGETMASKKMSERRQEKNRINNVLDEVGGIIYGNKEYAKKQRLKREAERKELAKEIYSSVLKGDFNDVTLSQIDKFIEDATPANPFGRRISQRLPQRMERALRQGARANAVDALFSRISESAVPANERFSEAGRREIEERKKELLKGWAIATGNWHTDLKEFTDDTEPIGEGKDSKVYSSKDGRYVIKASKGKPFGKRFRPDIDNIALFNDVFRDTRYEILGYGEIDGEFVRILQQPIVDFAESTPLTSEERREYMQSLGFEPLNDANTAFADGEIVIADLQKGNIVRDAAGNISVIDADAKLHTKDVGGDYTYPPVETDLPEGTDLGGTMFRRVFHGSGAKFDKFDHSFMGTGEGAQAYGWGTYVSEDRSVGKSYADTIGGYEFTGKKRGNVIRRLFDRYTGRQGADENTVEVAKRLLNEHGGYDAVLKEYAGLMPGGSLGKAVELIRNSDRLDWKGRHYLYTVEIPDDDGANYLHWDRPVADEVVDGMKDALLNERGEDIAGYAALKHGMSVEDIYGRLEYALGSDKAASEFLSGLGYVGISYPAWVDGARNYVIFNEDDAVIEDRIMFRRANKNQEVFVSNAQRAVEGIKQEKATPEQWIAMLKKNGGLKAGEEAWLGLEEWLNERGKRKGESGKTDPSAAGGSSPKTGAQSTVTKQEILDFIGANKIQIEEVNYTQFGYGLMDEATRKLEAELKEIGWDAMVEKYPGFDELFEVYDGELLWSEERASVGEYEDFIIDNKIVDLDSQSNAINETREKFTTEGLERKREIALTVPTVEPYNESDEVHFGDAGNGRAVAWVRFGETTDSEGNRVLVIDEIQSKRHQDGREKGYEKTDANDAFETYRDKMMEKYNLPSDQIYKILTNEEKEEFDRLRTAANEEFRTSSDVPSAPFEKNWHELAMKRMLRLAAEEGFDKVAWTTGEQQAERYNIAKVVSHIECEKVGKNGNKSFSMGLDYKFIVDPNGIVVSSKDEYIGKSIADIVGKPLANKMLEMQEGDTISGDGLRIGGEGMKGFYDRMLPSFVSKYTKKWGAKVGEVTMPNLRENNTMHSVDVTPEMKESVMEGQTMFRMGSRVDARMAEVASHFDGKELSAEQRAVADVFGGKADNLTISVKTQDGNTRNVEMRQGNDLAGAKHSLYAHYGTTKGVINADDLLLIPDVIANGERTENGKKAVYKLDVNGTKYTVVTYVKQNKEEFHNFYSNKKGQPSQSVNASIGDTHSARITEELASADKGSTSSAEMQEGETLLRKNDNLSPEEKERQNKLKENAKAIRRLHKVKANYPITALRNLGFALETQEQRDEHDRLFAERDAMSGRENAISVEVNPQAMTLQERITAQSSEAVWAVIARQHSNGRLRVQAGCEKGCRAILHCTK